MENQTEFINARKTFRGFLWLFFTQYISLIGSQLVSFSVTWYLTKETGSSLILSLATLSNMVPMILVSPFAGVIADRRSKNKILLIPDAIQAIATLSLIILFFFDVDRLWQILILLGIRGTCQGFQLPAAVSLNALMVPQKHIQRINALDRILMALFSILTPILGAFILGFMTIEQIYWFDVITFIPSAIALVLIKIPRVKTEEHKKIHFLEDFTSSLLYIKENKLISPFVLFATANFFVVPLFSLLPLLLKNYHGGSESNFGYMLASLQVGMLTGGVILMLIKKRPKMRGVVINAFINSIILLILALIPNTVTWNFWAVYAVAFFMGLVITLIDTQLMSILQLSIPKEFQGRIFSTLFTVIKSIMPLGLILWGAIGEFTGILFVFILTPSVSLITFIIIVLITPIFRFDSMHNSEVSSNANKEEDS